MHDITPVGLLPVADVFAGELDVEIFIRQFDAERRHRRAGNQVIHHAAAVSDALAEIPGTSSKSGALKISVAGKMTTKSGINGNAALARREKGEKLIPAMAQDIIDFLGEFAKMQ